MINGFEYSWEDIKVILPGSPLPQDAVTAIEFESSKAHENIYGAGARPVAMGRGKEEFTGKITVLQSLFEAMQAAVPSGKNLTHIAPFQVTVAFAPEGGVTTTHQLIGCRIKKIPISFKTGDANAEVELELAIFNINYNI